VLQGGSCLPRLGVRYQGEADPTGEGSWSIGLRRTPEAKRFERALRGVRSRRLRWIFHWSNRRAAADGGQRWNHRHREAEASTPRVRSIFFFPPSTTHHLPRRARCRPSFPNGPRTTIGHVGSERGHRVVVTTQLPEQGREPWGWAGGR